MYKAVEPSLEKILETPEINKAYLMGSFPSKRMRPGDVDVLGLTGEKDIGKVYKKSMETIGEMGEAPLHFVPFPETGNPPSRLLEEGMKRYGKDYRWLRILGLTGAMGGGMAASETLNPEEAEASPYGKIGKEFTKKLTKGVVSSSGEVLKGKEVFGKTVKSVVKGKGDWRYLQFTDGTERAITKDVARELVQEVGIGARMAGMAEMAGPNKLERAARSLKWHKERQQPFNTKKIQEEWLKVRQAHAKVAGQETTPYVYVDSEKVFLPQADADVLEAAGRVRIKRRD